MKEIKMSYTKMPKPNEALREFFQNNDVFAALFNGYFFHGENVISATALEPADTAYAVTVQNTDGKKQKINKYRDIVRKTELGTLVILGIEDQNKVHYAMPIRKMLYDVLGYSTEVSEKAKQQDSSEWTIEERLSNVSKGTTVTPIITVVFYTGETPWDGPTSLHDMMDMDDRICSCVPDYPLYVIDVGHDKKLSFAEQDLQDLQYALTQIYAEQDPDDREIKNSILSLTGILAGDQKLYETMVNKDKGGLTKMCRALEKRDEEIVRRITAEKDAEMATALKKRDAEIVKRITAEKDAEMATALKKRDAEIVKRITAEKDAEMATALKKRDEEIGIALEERDARIRELEKLLADNGIGANHNR